MGSKITREALELMGFEHNPTTKEFVLWAEDEENHIGVMLPMYDYPLCVTQYSGDSAVMELEHIRTLSQLRRLIRSLFGDEALPRRELSTITDEECRHIVTTLYDCDIVHMNVIRSDDAVHLSFRLRDGSIEWHDHIKIFFTGNARREVGDGENLGSGALSALLSYLINECDFHLPEFHGERDE